MFRSDGSTNITGNGNPPNSFKLYQNYPNPFNPSTTIKFDITNNANIKINIYNILGKKVSSLLNENLPAGSYEIVWSAPTGDGTELNSGVYFYKLETDNYSEIKRMVLLK